MRRPVRAAARRAKRAMSCCTVPPFVEWGHPAYSDSAPVMVVGPLVAGAVIHLVVMQAAAAPQLFDSLPYYDNDLETHPILREKVQHELAVETQKIQQETLHPRVPPSVELFVVSQSNVQHVHKSFPSLFY